MLSTKSILSGVKRIELTHQKRHTWDLSTKRTNSYCACANYVGRQLCEVGPIKKGEVIIAVKRVSNYYIDSEGVPITWYKRERWRLECWSEALRLEGISYKLSSGVVVEERPVRAKSKRQVSKVHGFTPDQMAHRKNLQSKRSTLTARMVAYKARPIRTPTIDKAILTIESQLVVINQALELPSQGAEKVGKMSQFSLDEWLSQRDKKL